MILTRVESRVATLTFNRPEKMNALNEQLVRSSLEFLQECAKNPAVGVIVVTGSGRAFCAGGDVSRMAEANQFTLEEKIDFLRGWQELSWQIYRHPKVVIAQVNGFAMGAGLGICLSCDIRVASEAAKFGTAYAKVGLGGDFGTTWLLTRMVGAPKAKELFFLADPIDAAEALRLGLVNRVTPHDQLEAATREWAERIANGPLVSYRYMKANINQAASVDFRTMLDREAETHQRCSETEDHREGARAFLEKRPPRFQGK